MTLKIGFAGTPEFARVALEALQDGGFDIALVLSQPDRPAGRGMKLQASPVKQLAQSLGIEVGQPAGLRLDGRHSEAALAAQALLRAARPDVIVVAAYGLILPAWVLEAAPLGCINIHASLLPRWRGAAPIHRAIEAGDARTGITVMQMDAGLDTGPALLEEAIDIAGDDTTATLHDKLAALGGRLIVRALAMAEEGRLRPVPQPEAGVTYAHKIAKDEAPIDWSLPAEVIERRIRAFDPFPGASLQLAGHPAVSKCWRAEVVPGVDGEPGAIAETGPRGPVVACGQGGLRLLEMQQPGGRRQPAAQAATAAAGWVPGAMLARHAS